MNEFAIGYLVLIGALVVGCCSDFIFYYKPMNNVKKDLKRCKDNNTMSYFELRQHLDLLNKEVLRLNTRVSKLEQGSNNDVEN